MHGDRAKAGHDHALRPMPMAHQPLAAVFGVLVSVAGKEGGDLRLDGLRQQRPRARAQNFGERVGELCWLDQLDDIILGHGVSLLCWRSGGLEHPHDTPPYPLTPSPTSAHSSSTIQPCSTRRPAYYLSYVRRQTAGPHGYTCTGKSGQERQPRKRKARRSRPVLLGRNASDVKPPTASCLRSIVA